MDMSEILMSIDVRRPEMLLKNIGEPQAAICLNIAKWNLGFVNLSRALFLTKGIIATSEERQKMIEKLDTSFVDVNVLFGQTDITMQEFLDLAEAFEVIGYTVDEDCVGGKIYYKYNK
jgi:hypothetical protein